MLSLGKALKDHEVLDVALTSYRAALVAVGDAGVEACPPPGVTLKSSLVELAARLAPQASAALIAQVENEVEDALEVWGKTAATSYRDKTDEVKALILLLAAAAEQMGERDDRYTRQFQEVTTQLQKAAQLNDLAAMRGSLGASVAVLNTCIANMTKDGQDAVARMRTQLATYEARLEEVERIASVDALTGLANRRSLERQIELRINQGQKFSVIYVDLNGFKAINDTFGHVSGDDLLRQFAAELKTAFRNTDVVARWGGDEFVVLLHGEPREAMAGLERIRRFVVGEYTIQTSLGQKKVNVTAAAGSASWQAGDTVDAVLQRADAAMYKQKMQPAASR